MTTQLKYLFKRLRKTPVTGTDGISAIFLKDGETELTEPVLNDDNCDHNDRKQHTKTNGNDKHLF